MPFIFKMATCSINTTYPLCVYEHLNRPQTLNHATSVHRGKDQDWSKWSKGTLALATQFHVYRLCRLKTCVIQI